MFTEREVAVRTGYALFAGFFIGLVTGSALATIIISVS